MGRSRTMSGKLVAVSCRKVLSASASWWIKAGRTAQTPLVLPALVLEAAVLLALLLELLLELLLVVLLLVLALLLVLPRLLVLALLLVLVLDAELVEGVLLGGDGAGAVLAVEAEELGGEGAAVELLAVGAVDGGDGGAAVVCLRANVGTSMLVPMVTLKVWSG